MDRFIKYLQRYVTECKTSLHAFLLSVVLLAPILIWQYQLFSAFILPFILILSLPTILVFCALIALSNTLAVRIGTLLLAIAVNFYALRDELLASSALHDAKGTVLTFSWNTAPVIFWQLFLSFAVFYAMLAHRRLTEWRALEWEALEAR